MSANHALMRFRLQDAPTMGYRNRNEHQAMHPNPNNHVRAALTQCLCTVFDRTLDIATTADMHDAQTQLQGAYYAACETSDRNAQLFNTAHYPERVCIDLAAARGRFAQDGFTLAAAALEETKLAVEAAITAWTNEALALANSALAAAGERKQDAAPSISINGTALTQAQSAAVASALYWFSDTMMADGAGRSPAEKLKAEALASEAARVWDLCFAPATSGTLQ